MAEPWRERWFVPQQIVFLNAMADGIAACPFPHQGAGPITVRWRCPWCSTFLAFAYEDGLDGRL